MSTGIPADASSIRVIGVIGAGQMGAGIAQISAVAGISVLLFDAKADAVVKALDNIGRAYDRQVSKGAMTLEDRDDAIGRIRAIASMEGFGRADLVIEAATEKEEVKRAIFAALGQHLKPECLVATNTSSISITRLAAASGRPEKFIGMHFMNPVPVMKLIEVIRGIATDESTFDAICSLSEKLGKSTAVSEDFPAFIVNRILVPMINEAVFALYEGVAGVLAIDNAMRLGANHKMGPLELADFIGLDTCLSIMQVLYEGLSDSKYRPCPLLVKYVEAGWLGRKSGRGFYDYSVNPPKPTR